MEEIRTTLFFNDTEDLKEGFDLLPPGQYEFEVKEVKSGVANSGRGRLGVRVEVVNECPQQGRTCWDNWNLPVTDGEKPDKPDGRIFKFWKQVAKAAPDAVGDDGSGQQRLLVDNLVGLHYRATVKHEEYNGKPTMRLEFPFPLPKAAPAAPAAAGPKVFKKVPAGK